MRGEEPPAARLQALQRDRTDSDPGQSHHLVAKFREHPAHFAVLALGQNHLNYRGLAFVGDWLNSFGADFALGQPDTFHKFLKHVGTGGARHDGSIDLLNAEPWVRQFIGELAIIGQNHQPSAHFVEPADGIDALGNVGNEVDNPGTAGRVFIRRDVALRLVNGDIGGSLVPNHVTIDSDSIAAWDDFGAEFANDHAVYGHSSVKNVLFTGTP